MEVGLVVILVLAVVDGTELEDAEAAGGSSRDGSLAGALRDGSSSGVSARGADRLLGVRRRGRGREREESRVRDRGEREELLGSGRRHVEGRRWERWFGWLVGWLVGCGFGCCLT